MADLPIIFSGPMVRAMIEGRKTQTRRLATSPLKVCRAGNRLWVRETFATPFRRTETQSGAIYRADGPEYLGMAERAHNWGAEARWTPSIHMPRWASRLTLVATRVRFERLHDLTECDAIAEGVRKLPNQLRRWVDYTGETTGEDSAWDSYRSLWAKLHGWDSWGKNPEVVVIEFQVREGNIDNGAVA